MPPYLEYVLPAEGDDPWLVVIKILSLLGIAAVFVFKGTDRVPAGQLALRLRMGKVVYHRWGPLKGKAVVVGPGWHPLFPFFHTLWKISTLIRMLDLEEQTRSMPGKVETVRASIEFEVMEEHIDLALLRGEDINALVRLMCSEKFCELNSLMVPYPEIPRLLLDCQELNETAAKLGVKLLALRIPYWGETDGSQLASILVAGRKRKQSSIELAVSAFRKRFL